MARDPMREMQMEEEPGALMASSDTKTYYFCSPGCRQEFLSRAAADGLDGSPCRLGRVKTFDKLRPQTYTIAIEIAPAEVILEPLRCRT